MKFTLFSRAIQALVTGVDQRQQNGVAERAHKTIYDRVGPTLGHARLPRNFWPEIAPVIKTQHGSVSSVVRRQAGPITTQSGRTQRGIPDPTQAEEEGYGAKNKAMHPTRL
jgi:hypothetical protein